MLSWVLPGTTSTPLPIIALHALHALPVENVNAMLLVVVLVVSCRVVVVRSRSGGNAIWSPWPNGLIENDILLCS
jgi:hypothetical protein